MTDGRRHPYVLWVLLWLAVLTLVGAAGSATVTLAGDAVDTDEDGADASPSVAGQAEASDEQSREDRTGRGTEVRNGEFDVNSTNGTETVADGESEMGNSSDDSSMADESSNRVIHAIAVGVSVFALVVILLLGRL